MRISDWSSDVCSSDLVKGYILPQFDGWMKNGALTGYEMYMNRYPVGTPWDVLFIQHYRDMESFGRRQRVTAETRAGLRANPEWSAWSRSGERRVGNECVSTCRSRWSPLHSKKTQ